MPSGTNNGAIANGQNTSFILSYLYTRTRTSSYRTVAGPGRVDETDTQAGTHVAE